VCDRGMFDDERAAVVRGRDKIVEAPAVVVFGRGGNFCFRIGIKGYVEVVQRVTQSLADGFDEGFLAGPAFEERSWKVGLTDVAQVGDFSRGEEALGQVACVGKGSDGFDIHAEFTAVTHGEKGEIAGMREVEAERVAWERRLSVRLLRKVQGAGIGVEGCAEDVAQSSVCYCELTLGVLFDEAIGACALFGREQVAQPLQGGR